MRLSIFYDYDSYGLIESYLKEEISMRPFSILFGCLLTACVSAPASIPKGEIQNSLACFKALSHPENSKAHLIVSVGSGKVLDIHSASEEPGMPAIQWSYNQGSNQEFILHNLQNGYYKIEAAHSHHVLDVRDADLAVGAVIQQWPENGQENQAWQLVSAGDGQYRIVSQHTRQLLSVAGNARDEGAYMIQAPDQDSPFQRWLIVPVAKANRNCQQAFDE